MNDLCSLFSSSYMFSFFHSYECAQLLSDTAPPFDLQGALADSASIGAAASPSAGNASNEAEDTLSDAALTCLALTNCFLAAATSVLGHHYLASHQRASLHAFARGVFLDAKVRCSLDLVTWVDA